MPKVILNSLTGATEEQKQFAENALALLEEIVNHPKYYKEVTTYRYSTRRFRTDNGEYENYDNTKIWEIISGGKELNEPANGEINLICKFEKWIGYDNVMGEVIPPNPLITTNTVWLNKIIARRDPLSLSAHWMHEWMHVAGFRHKKGSDLKWTDVAYSIGDIAVEVGKLILSEGQKSRAVTEQLGSGYKEAVEKDNCEVSEGEE